MSRRGPLASEDIDPVLVKALLSLVEPACRGDPMSRLCWTNLSTRHLAVELRRLGPPIPTGTSSSVTWPPRSPSIEMLGTR